MPCDGLREAWRVNRPGQSILGPQRNVTGVQASSRFNELGQTAGHCVYHASGLAGVGVPAGIDRWMLRHARYQCAVDLKIVPEPEVRSKSSPRSGNQRPLKRPDKRAFTRALQSTHTASGPAPGSRCTSHLGVLRRRSACDEPNVEWASPLAVPLAVIVHELFSVAEEWGLVLPRCATRRRTHLVRSTQLHAPSHRQA